MTAIREKKEAALEEHKLQLEEASAEKLEKQRNYLNTARQRARDSEAKIQKLTRKLCKVEKKLEAALAEDDDSSDSCDEMDVDEQHQAVTAVRLPFELLPRRDEQGRWQAESPEVHALRLAQLGRGVAPSSASTVSCNNCKL
ncbi:hypothetical protein AB1Y20_018002 [Prymnesium parvum]|uniref:Uncharacterized protein n=1 Tax=Prymnesium parvum TaxID=97485 RepID=A0AB34JM86_PRYPA|mmetsp:Transcript_5813/g.8875  ORF Transcript_5813/g.8875 Transcript_5813/m.8875 type:complete len:142 (+) Transcript_5813:184-609(+)